MKYLPTNDLLFRKIFASRGNEHILKDFVQCVLGFGIEEVTATLSRSKIKGRMTLAKARRPSTESPSMEQK